MSGLLPAIIGGQKTDDLSIEVGGSSISGWQEIEVTLRAEGFPNSFDIAFSTKQPLTNSVVIAKAGDPCAVYLGGDLVISGYVDMDANGGDARGHMLRLVGRGKTQDLVDCSAEWPSGQLINGTALDIATKLAQPYGIDVRMGDGADPGPQVPQWALNYTDTGADIIQRIARAAGLLAYEDANGALVLGTVGTTRAASGAVLPGNVQAWSVENSMNGRYSEVVCCLLGLAALSDIPGSDFFDIEEDPNVPRHRRLDIILEQVGQDPVEFTKKKAMWEVARRAGRSSVVHVTVDSWRDAEGTLWTPNTSVPVDVPGLRVDKLLVLSEVTFRRSSEGGTTADLMLMPPSAFTPEPLSLLPINAADVQGVDQ